MTLCKYDPVNIACPYDNNPDCEFCSDRPLDSNVNHPYHYTRGGIECIEAIKASMTPQGFQDYCKGNVLKYIWRWRDKGGIEDLEKAEVYLGWLIESVEKENESKGSIT